MQSNFTTSLKLIAPNSSDVTDLKVIGRPSTILLCPILAIEGFTGVKDAAVCASNSSREGIENLLDTRSTWENKR